MKVLEEGNIQYENGFNVLSENEINSINGGWCFILICGANMSSIFGFMIDNRFDQPIIA